MIVGSEMKQEGVLVKLRWTPHRGFGRDDLLDVLHQRRALSTFWPQRVDHHVVLLSTDGETIQGPVRTNLGGCVDHDVPVRKLPLGLARLLSSTVDDLPTSRCLNAEFH